MKQLFTGLLVLSILFSLAYFSRTVAQEGHPKGQRQNTFEADEIPGPPQGPPSGRQPCPPPELTDLQLQELMAFCKEYFPTFYKNIDGIKDSNPVLYKKITGERFPLMLHLKELMKKEMDLFKIVVRKIELEDKSGELARNYKDTEGDDNAKIAIENELEKILSEIFILRQKESQLHADKMEKQVKHMRETIAEREKNKDLIIKDGLNKLTGKSEYLEW